MTDRQPKDPATASTGVCRETRFDPPAAHPAEPDRDASPLHAALTPTRRQDTRRHG